MALACATAWVRAAESRVKVCWSAGASLRARALRDCADATIRASVVESFSRARSIESTLARSRP